MLQDSAATIFALASGAGLAAIAVVRVSGPDCAGIVGQLCNLPPPRLAALRTLRDSYGMVLDRAVVLWLPGPANYTGEDSAELHVHGGQAVLAGVVDALTGLGARPAQPGEFTRRAFQNGRMDLLEAEAVADLIAAETAAQRTQALRQLGGALGSIYSDWAARLVRLLAQQEALIDFPDEDLPIEVEEKLLNEISDMQLEMESHLADGRRGERLRTGLVFAVAGPPNVGKSTLINALCRREMSIVSPFPGTTRDVIEARIEFAGIPVTLLDTAGLRDTADPVEAEGVRRARARIMDADLILALTEACSPASEIPCELPGIEILSVTSKIDLLPDGHSVPCGLSVLTGAGMDALHAALEAAAKRLAGCTETPAMTRVRHRASVGEAALHLAASLNARLVELRGEELRLALQSIGRLTGRVGVEEILDSVFGQFCIGK